MQNFKEEFGRKFIILPNAMYGNWTGSLGIDGNEGAVDSLLSLMTVDLNRVCP
jgi:predicted secreted acid phosphatase